MDIVDFLRARYDQDQADAERHACALDCLRGVAQDWHAVRNQGGRASTRDALRSVGLGDLGQDWPGKPEGTGHGIHYSTMRGTAMDPARVLADIASKRAVLERCGWAYENGGGSAFVYPVLQQLATVYREHPDYDPEWSPEA